MLYQTFDFRDEREDGIDFWIDDIEDIIIGPTIDGPVNN